MFQIGFGMNAFRSGLFLLALFAGNMGMKSLTTPVLRRFGFRRVLIVNGIVVGVAILLCALLSPRTPWMLVVLVLFVNGLCRSMQFTSMGTLAFVDVPFERMSAANSFASTVQQLTSSMGVAVGALALRMATVARGHAHGTPDMMDFHIAFALVSVLAFAAIFDCFQLPPDAGSITSGHHAKQEPELTQG
jgi:MFS family permease